MGRRGVDSCSGIPKEIPLLSDSYEETGVGLDNCDIGNSTVMYLQIKKSGKRPLSLKEKKKQIQYIALNFVSVCRGMSIKEVSARDKKTQLT